MERVRWRLLATSFSKHLKPETTLFFLKTYTFKCFACIYVCTPQVCLVPIEIRRGHRIPWDKSYRQL